MEFLFSVNVYVFISIVLFLWLKIDMHKNEVFIKC